VQEEIEEVLFAYDTLDYNRILKVVGKLGNDNRLNFKVIPSDSALNIGELPPLMAVDYLTPRGVGGSLRKLSNLILGR
jgi:hypothetical protein